MRVGIIVLVAAGTAAAGPIPPFNYLEHADSVWLDQPGYAVEDMEDVVFDLPGVTASTGTLIGPSGVTDSVDGDDEDIDGSGQFGHSFFSPSGNAGITFTLDPVEIGFTPTRAGLVWTDGSGVTTFEAFDLDGNSLGTKSAQVADNFFSGETEEDHFFGWEHAGGIGAIKIMNSSGGIEVDHVQYAGGEVVEVCAADCDGNGVLNILDFVCFQNAWLTQEFNGDCDCDGTYSILDFVCYQDLFVSGCP